MPPDSPHTIWAPLFVFALGSHNPLGGLVQECIKTAACVRACNFNISLQSSQKYLKIELFITYLATRAYVYRSCAVHVTIFSTGGKFRLVSNLRSYTLCTLAHLYSITYHTLSHHCHQCSLGYHHSDQRSEYTEDCCTETLQFHKRLQYR